MFVEAPEARDPEAGKHWGLRAHGWGFSLRTTLNSTFDNRKLRPTIQTWNLNPKPKALSSRPETLNSKPTPQTRDSEPEIRDPEPETRGLKRETRRQVNTGDSVRFISAVSPCFLPSLC